MNEISYDQKNLNQMGYRDGEIITYCNKKTKELGISAKKVIGEGDNAVIKHHSEYDFVIKKFKKLSSIENDNEFTIGRILGDHNPFIKHHNLFKKIDKDNKTILTYKIVMDFITGSTINQAEYTHKELKGFFNDTQEACLILVKSNIVWDDLNRKNLMITDKKQLKFCDYEKYRHEPDSRRLAIGIFQGAITVLDHLIGCCSGMKNKWKTANKAFELFDTSIDKFTKDAKVSLIDEEQNKDIHKQVEDIVKSHFQKILEMHDGW